MEDGAYLDVWGGEIGDYTERDEDKYNEEFVVVQEKEARWVTKEEVSNSQVKYIYLPMTWFYYFSWVYPY